MKADIILFLAAMGKNSKMPFRAVFARYGNDDYNRV
jgi:hypothetical protein